MRSALLVLPLVLHACDSSSLPPDRAPSTAQFSSPATDGGGSEAPLADPFGPGNGQFARATVLANGDIQLDLAFASLLSAPEGYCAEYQGRCLRPGEYVPVVQMVISQGTSLPLNVSSADRPAGMEISWFHSETPNDPSDPLSCRLLGDGNYKCGERYVRDDLIQGQTAYYDLAIGQIDPQPHGPIDLDLTAHAFEMHDGDLNGLFCCGTLTYSLHGFFDADGWVHVDGYTGWPGSHSCDFNSLEDAAFSGRCTAGL